MIGRMRAYVVAVHPGAPTIVDISVADDPLRGEWIGPSPDAGELVDVELDIDAVLGWDDTIALEGAEATLREGPRLYGRVELREQDLLSVRVADGLLLIQVDDASIDLPLGTPVVVVAECLKVYPTNL
ncbi:hypothetical protein AB0M47_32440 [Hamadaea sp. NPDC051192]|uniref:hypothetical protein n=1 Tax=Hamadaea sp. NPDC051192 TaxID=3154940 RepID=UPI00342B63DF